MTRKGRLDALSVIALVLLFTLFWSLSASAQPQEVRQFQDDPVFQPPVPHHQQARGIARLGGAERDVVVGEIEVEIGGLHQAAQRPWGRGRVKSCLLPTQWGGGPPARRWRGRRRHGRASDPTPPSRRKGAPRHLPIRYANREETAFRR